MENTNNKKTPAYWIKTGLFFLLAAVLVVYILIEAFAPSKTVNVFGFKPYVVLTQSMEPEINEDDVVIVKKADTASLEEGDIITFLADINNDGEKNIVTHYIYSIGETASGEITIQTNRHYDDPDNASPDPWTVGEEDVLGEHMLTIPKIGVVIRFLQSPFGLAALVVNAAIIGAIVLLLKGEKKEPKASE